MADKKISALTDVSTPLAGTEVVPVVQSGSTKKVSIANLTAGRVVGASGLTVDGNAAVQIAIGLNTAGNSTASLIMGKVAASGGTIVNTISLATYGGAYGSAIKATSDLSATTASTLSLQTTPGGGGVPTDRISIDDVGNTTINTGNLVQGTAAKGINFTANTPLAGMTSQLLNWYEEGTFTPTVTASSGTLTTVSATGNYTRIGRQVTVNISITLTNIGTASGALIATLPWTCGFFPAIGVGREDQNTGDQLQARIPSSTPGSVFILKYNNTSAIGTGNVIQITITYFV